MFNTLCLLFSAKRVGIVNSNNLASLTRSKFQSGGGGTKHRGLSRWTTNSFVLDIFIVSLFFMDQFCTWENSTSRETEHVSGTNKLEMSAHLTIWLVSSMGVQSAIRITKRHWPTPEPWTIARLIAIVTEIWMSTWVNCVLSLMKDSTHSITFWSTPYCTSLVIDIAWSTLSKVLEQPIKRHRTYLLFSSKFEIVWVRSTSAASVLPESWNRTGHIGRPAVFVA